MKINSSTPPPVQGPKSDSAAPAGKRMNGAGDSSGAGSATLKLSELSSRLTELASSLAAAGEFDQAKVDEIKQAIVEGRFKVDPEVVADRMLATLRDQLEPPSGR